MIVVFCIQQSSEYITRVGSNAMVKCMVWYVALLVEYVEDETKHKRFRFDAKRQAS